MRECLLECGNSYVFAKDVIFNRDIKLSQFKDAFAETLEGTEEGRGDEVAPGA